MKNRRGSEREYYIGRMGGSVFVGPLMQFALPSRGEIVLVSQLFTLPGMLDDLHDFADKLGLRRPWFQYHHTLPHYDISENVRVRALGRGAREANKAELCDTIRTWRDAALDCRDRAISEQLGEPVDPVRKDRFIPAAEPQPWEDAQEFHEVVAEFREQLFGGKK